MDILFAEDSALWSSREGTTHATPQCDVLEDWIHGNTSVGSSNLANAGILLQIGPHRLSSTFFPNYFSPSILLFDILQLDRL